MTRPPGSLPPPARRGFTVTELMVAVGLGALLMAFAFGIWRWLSHASRETVVRDAGGLQMRLLHEALRADTVAATGWNCSDGRQLEILGTVDTAGRPVARVLYTFDADQRAVTRDDGDSTRTIGFAEASRDLRPFAFTLSFLDDTRRRSLPPGQAAVLRVEVRMGGERGAPQAFSCEVTRASRFSADVSAGDLTWQGP